MPVSEGRCQTNSSRRMLEAGLVMSDAIPSGDHELYGPLDGVVTIVLTTCDRPDAVRRALRSALLQDHHSVEVIVIDDGIEHAVDAEGLLSGLDVHHRATVKVERTGGRHGANAARNRGLAHATGDWVMFLDDDDELRPHMVSASLAAAKASRLPPPVAVVSGIDQIKNGTVVSRHVPSDSSPKGGAYRVSSTTTDAKAGLAAFNTLVTPTHVMRDVGGFDERIRAAMHTDLFLRVNAECSIQALGEITYLMHHHGGERRSTAYLDRAEGTLRTLSKHREVYARYPREQAASYANIARHYLLAGRWRAALLAALRAMRSDASSPDAKRMLLMSMAGPRGYMILRRVAGPRRHRAVSKASSQPPD